MFRRATTLLTIAGLLFAPLAHAAQSDPAPSGDIAAPCDASKFEEIKAQFLNDLDKMLQTRESFYQRHKGKIWGTGMAAALVLTAVIVTVGSGGAGAPSIPAAAAAATSCSCAATGGVCVSTPVIIGIGASVALVAGTFLTGPLVDYLKGSDVHFDRQAVTRETEEAITQQRNCLLAAQTLPAKLLETFNAAAIRVLEKHSETAVHPDGK